MFYFYSNMVKKALKKIAKRKRIIKNIPPDRLQHIIAKNNRSIVRYMKKHPYIKTVRKYGPNRNINNQIPSAITPNVPFFNYNNLDPTQANKMKNEIDKLRNEREVLKNKNTENQHLINMQKLQKEDLIRENQRLAEKEKEYLNLVKENMDIATENEELNRKIDLVQLKNLKAKQLAEKNTRQSIYNNVKHEYESNNIQREIDSINNDITEYDKEIARFNNLIVK